MDLLHLHLPYVGTSWVVVGSGSPSQTVTVMVMVMCSLSESLHIQIYAKYRKTCSTTLKSPH
jgi:hypothetical protein